jgi:hypothetical protein
MSGVGPKRDLKNEFHCSQRSGPVHGEDNPAGRPELLESRAGVGASSPANGSAGECQFCTGFWQYRSGIPGSTYDTGFCLSRFTALVMARNEAVTMLLFMPTPNRERPLGRLIST